MLYQLLGCDVRAVVYVLYGTVVYAVILIIWLIIWPTDQPIDGLIVNYST